MAETDTPPYAKADEEAFYWEREFLRFGMTIAQAEALAFTDGLDRHAIREALERGCRPELAFQIYGP